MNKYKSCHKGKCFIFTGGEGPKGDFLPEYPQRGDIVIAADSGFDLAYRFSVPVDVALGDFDSLMKKELLDSLPKENILEFSSEKDHTDTELALIYALDSGYDEIILIGGGGGRLDHLLGIFYLFKRNLAPDRWYGSFGEAYLLKASQINGYTYPRELGALVSFFPLSEKVSVPWSNGLKWELTGLELRLGAFSLSNEVLSSPFRVGLEQGSMIMIFPEIKE